MSGDHLLDLSWIDTTADNLAANRGVQVLGYDPQRAVLQGMAIGPLAGAAGFVGVAAGGYAATTYQLGYFGTGAVAGAAGNLTYQGGGMAAYQFTDGYIGQKDFSFTQLGASTLWGGSLSSVAGNISDLWSAVSTLNRVVPTAEFEAPQGEVISTGSSLATESAGAGTAAEGVPTVGQQVYGPYYEQAKQLHAQNPSFFPDPDAPGTAIVSGSDLTAARAEYQSAAKAGDLPQGHHVQGLAFGGENTATNITFTGESTIRASQLDGLDLSFYSDLGYGKQNASVLKIYQETPGGVFQFGLNPVHTEATTFQNQVLLWQRQQGLR
jgi:hypothetical protein